jgi:hypothetical protein
MKFDELDWGDIFLINDFNQLKNKLCLKIYNLSGGKNKQLVKWKLKGYKI